MNKLNRKLNKYNKLAIFAGLTIRILNTEMSTLKIVIVVSSIITKIHFTINTT